MKKICPKCNTDSPQAANYCRSCGYNFPEQTKQGITLFPAIKEVIIVEPEYTIGSLVTIMWEVENASTIMINGEDVTNSDSYQFLIKGATNIEFVASNEYRDVRKFVPIKPRPLPKIISFTSNRKKIKDGDQIKLSWKTLHANSVRLRSSFDSTEHLLDGKMKHYYYPKVGEVLTLVCYAKDKNVEVTQDLVLDIIATAAIDEFSCDRTEVIESMPLKLSWSVRNATSVILLPGNIVVTGKHSITMHPIRSTEYQLKATNSISSTTEILSVKVKPLPKLNYSMPDCSELIKLPEFNLDFSNLVSNIGEINIDKWVLFPLTAGNENNSFFEKVKKWLKKK